MAIIHYDILFEKECADVSYSESEEREMRRNRVQLTQRSIESFDIILRIATRGWNKTDSWLNAVP